jgi:hypothetical protein
MVTLLNTSGGPISAGELIEWVFAENNNTTYNVTARSKRSKSTPRRIGVKIAASSSPKIIGRALSFSKSGEIFDLLLRM